MWIVDHLVLVTVIAVMLLVAIAGGGLWLAVRKFPGHPAAMAAVSVATSIAIGALFTVTLNNAWAMKRDLDQAERALRADHLRRLQPVLRAEAARLGDMARKLEDTAYLALEHGYARAVIWQDDVMAPDLRSHFPDYFNGRERLLARIMRHDAAYQRVTDDIGRTLSLSPGAQSYRSGLVASLVNKCVGIGEVFKLQITGTDVYFSWALGGGGGSLGDVTGLKQAADAFDRYRFATSMTKDCRNLQQQAREMAADAKDLASGATAAAEETVLRGSCKYVAPDLLK